MRTLIFFIVLPFFIFGQDVWQDGGEVFTDNKILPPGSIIYIHFNNNLVINYKNKIQQTYSSSQKSDSVQNDLIDFLPEFSLSSTGNKNSDSDLSSTQNFTGSIAATIISYNKNSSTYTISARQTMLVGTKNESISFRGLVASQKIQSGVVQSVDVANVIFSYSGITINKKKQTKASDFSSLDLTPATSGTNTNNQKAIDLSDAKKRELFLEYFNILFNELF